MKTQISRYTYRPTRHYSGVYQQQGRMIVDADLNEQAEITDRRLTDLLRVTVKSGAPAEGGLALKVVGTNVLLVPGKLYVDGLAAVLEADPAQAAGIALNRQADYPAYPALASGSFRLYADVWERPVTALEDPELMDTGLHGADTASRSQTMLQVKTCPLAVNPESATENPPLGNAPLSLILNTSTTSGTASDPCAATASVSERIGNYLFRVEVHDVYREGGKDFLVIKWSRDNGAEACRVGDEPPGFTQNVWVWEFFDKDSEKQAGQQFPMIAAVTRFRRGLLSETYTVPGGDVPKTFARQWDGFAIINLTDNTVSGRERGVALSAGPSGQVSWDTTAGRVLVLKLELMELRLQLRAPATSANHAFLAGDHWLACVREADRDELAARNNLLLDKGLPLGIIHHYLELGRWNGTVLLAPTILGDDAWQRRMSFPPLTALEALKIGYSVPASVGVANSFGSSFGFVANTAENLKTSMDRLLGASFTAEEVPLGTPVCQGLKDSGVTNVLGALDYLCGTKITQCAITVPATPPGQLQILLTNFANDLNAKDIWLCLMPGDHVLATQIVAEGRRSIRIDSGTAAGATVHVPDRFRLQLDAAEIVLEGVCFASGTQTMISLKGERITSNRCIYRRLTAAIAPPQVLLSGRSDSAQLSWTHNRMVDIRSADYPNLEADFLTMANLQPQDVALVSTAFGRLMQSIDLLRGDQDALEEIRDGIDAAIANTAQPVIREIIHQLGEAYLVGGSEPRKFGGFGGFNDVGLWAAYPILGNAYLGQQENTTVADFLVWELQGRPGPNADYDSSNGEVLMLRRFEFGTALALANSFLSGVIAHNSIDGEVLLMNEQTSGINPREHPELKTPPLPTNLGVVSGSAELTINGNRLTNLSSLIPRSATSQVANNLTVTGTVPGYGSVHLTNNHFIAPGNSVAAIDLMAIGNRFDRQSGSEPAPTALMLSFAQCCLLSGNASRAADNWARWRNIARIKSESGNLLLSVAA
jgi:hypothetical protein